MVIALFNILKDKSNSLKGNKYLVAGYIFYGIAAVCSATRNIGNWYAVVGEMVLDSITTGAEISWSGGSVIYFRDPLGFWFMDYVVEESLELLGAAFLASAIAAFIVDIKRV